MSAVGYIEAYKSTYKLKVHAMQWLQPRNWTEKSQTAQLVSKILYIFKLTVYFIYNTPLKWESTSKIPSRNQ